MSDAVWVFLGAVVSAAMASPLVLVIWQARKSRDDGRGPES
jgi:hypothetical protein